MLAQQKSASGLWPQKAEIPKVGRAAFVRLSGTAWYDESFKGNPSNFISVATHFVLELVGGCWKAGSITTIFRQEGFHNLFGDGSPWQLSSNGPLIRADKSNNIFFASLDLERRLLTIEGER